MPKPKYFPPLKIDIPQRMIYRLIGCHKRNDEIPAHTRISVERESAIARELVRFKGVYLKSSAEVLPDNVCLKDGYVIQSRKFANWVKGCGHVYLFAVTAGPLFNERIQQLIQMGNISKAMIADAAGSAAAESCAQAADSYIHSLEMGKALTKRYSPGYGDWNVKDNRKFIEVVGADKINIHTVESGLMLPEKSVSAAIGVKSGFGL